MTPEVPLRVPEPLPGAEPVAWAALLAGGALAWVLLALLRRRLGGRMHPFLAAVLALLGAAGALAWAEVAVRQYEGRQDTLRPFLMDPDLIWIMAPNLRDAPVGPRERQTIASTNELGLRDLEVPVERKPGEFRILALGDSWTFGSGVGAQEMWAKRLQARLRQRHPGRVINVLNAGQSGFSYLQGYHLLRQILPVYKPDLLLVGGFNPVSNRDIGRMEELTSADPRVEGLLWTLRRSRLYQVMRRRFAPGSRPPLPAPAEEGVNPHSVRYAGAIAREAAARGVPAVFFYHAFEPPYLPEAGDWYGPNTNPELRHLPRLPGVAALEVLPRWDAVARGLWLPNDPVHPNAAGHDAMAEGVFRYLVDSRVLEGELPVSPAR